MGQVLPKAFLLYRDRVVQVDRAACFHSILDIEDNLRRYGTIRIVDVMGARVTRVEYGIANEQVKKTTGLRLSPGT